MDQALFSQGQLARIRATERRKFLSLPVEVQLAILEDPAVEQKSIQPLNYYSTTRHDPVIAAGPPVTYTPDNAERRAFGYAAGGDGQAAGFAAGVQTTFGDTCLIQPNTTLRNADYYFWGISAELCTNSDMLLAAQLWREGDVQMSFNGSGTFELCPLSRIPAAGGLYGTGRSAICEPPFDTSGIVDGGPGALVAFGANGNPQSGNYLAFRTPYLWSAIGGAGSDSQFSLIIRQQRSQVITAAVARVAAAGINPYTPPATAAAGARVDVRWHLHGVEVGNRSKNQ